MVHKIWRNYLHTITNNNCINIMGNSLKVDII